MRIIIKLLMVSFFIFLSLLIGAKYSDEIKKYYHGAVDFINPPKELDEAALESRRKTVVDLISNELDFSHLDQPAKLDVREHVQYLQGLQEKHSNAVLSPEMIDIPAGQFKIGCRRDGCPLLEKSGKNIQIAAFQIAATETTFEQWDVCVADGGCDVLPGDYGWGRGDKPVVNVSWDDIQQYIKWLNSKTSGGYRLPTESEWEYAARAGQYEHDYPWQENRKPSCDETSKYAARFGVAAHFKREIGECEYYGTIDVASFQPNAWGLYDVLGNVGEYVQDCAGNVDMSLIPDDGSAYTGALCYRRIQRGGAWSTSSNSLYLTLRRHYYRWQMYDRIGFRLARDVLIKN